MWNNELLWLQSVFLVSILCRLTRELTDCQKSHWKDHKNECAPINSGTWQSVHKDEGKDGYQAIFNRREQNIDDLKPQPVANSLENLNHGERPFIVKVQLGGPPSEPNSSLLIYDRKRELLWQISLFSGAGYSDPGYPKIVKVVQERGWRGIKAFMWGRKIADNEISICLDPLPSQNVSW